MTSFAFILGCVPLAIASGAGSISRQVMGYTVIFGMLAASFIAIFLIPVTYYVVEKISHKGDTGAHARSRQRRRKGRWSPCVTSSRFFLTHYADRLHGRPRLSASHGGDTAILAR